MKVVTIKANLKDGLNAVERATGNSSISLPILKNVFIEASDKGVRLCATNLDIAITYFMSGKVIEKGKITTPTAILSSIVSNLTTDRINLEGKGDTLEVVTDNYEGTIASSPADDFPIIPDIQNRESFIQVNGDILKHALERVTVASQPSSEFRPELASVLLDFTLDSIKLTATDSFRLAESAIPPSQFSSTFKDPFRILLPTRTAQELLRLLKGNDTVKLFTDTSQVLFATDRFELVSRLTDGTFPDYQSIIPQSFQSESIVQREEFIGALRLTGVLSGREGEVKLRSSKGGKAIEVTSSDQATGKNSYVLPAKIKGEFEEVTFNWRYLVDGFQTFSCEEVFFGIAKGTRHGFLRDPKDASYFYLLAPLATY